MALNSAVTQDGGEISRATASQAMAARTEPTTDMNPVLLKPSSDTGSQVIIQGKVLSTGTGAMDALAYQAYKQTAKNAVLQSFERLQQQFQAIVVEGAGSPAEVNLRLNDIANMGFAETADVPVVLVADIDRGGVFAQLIGTLLLLSASEQSRVVGFIINKFRGDLRLLQPGLEWLTQQTGRPVFGVMPYLHGLELSEEDAINQQQQQQETRLTVVVPVLPRMSNHTDVDLLRFHPQIDLKLVYAPEPLPPCDLIILPGSKQTIADLTFLRQHWAPCLARHLRYGGKIFGICGGLQMLGQHIADPFAMESAQQSTEGLGYLPLYTVMQQEKTLTHSRGIFQLGGAESLVQGYEIHLGHTTATTPCQGLFRDSNSTCPGYLSADNQVAGSYWHGLFDEPKALQLLAAWAGRPIDLVSDLASRQQRSFERLADAGREHLDVPALQQLLTSTAAPFAQPEPKAKLAP
jgi:adenosylcobyric acid synthase